MGTRIISRRFLTVLLVVILLPTLITTAAADPVHGSVAFVEVKYGNITTFQASAVEVSPDGNYLYLGAAGGTITVFKRDLNTGRLLRVQRLNDDGVAADGLYGLSDIVISSDSKHLYTSAYHDDAVSIFTRNISTGQLTYEGMMVDGVGGVDGLDGAESLAITPDGVYIYAAGSEDNAIARFERNSTTGLLTYLVPAVYDGSASVNDIGGVHGLAISLDGKHLYATANDDDAVTSFKVSNLTGDITYVNHIKDTDPGVDGLNGARGVTVSPDDKHVYVSAFFDDSVATFSRNTTSGALTYVEVDKDGGTVADGLDAASDVVVSPDGSYVYVSSFGDNAIIVFRRNAGTGALNLVQRRFDNTIHADGLEGALQMTLSPDSSFLYVAARLEGENEGALTIFRRNPETGKLTYLHLVDELSNVNGPVGVAVSPDSKNIYIASNDSNRLTVCSRDMMTGKLRELEYFRDNDAGINGLAGARAVDVSPDGSHVYVAGHNDNGIAIFNRDASDGTLVFNDVVLNSDLGVSGLEGIQSLTVSPTGGYLYAVSSGNIALADTDSLVVFSRDTNTGALTFIKRFQDGIGVDGLNDAYHVAVSADGGHVYVAAFSDDSISHFEWVKPSGLTYRTTLIDGYLGIVDGLDGANNIVISPDGTRLYVASRIDDAIAMFIRGTSSGTLIYHSMIKDGVGGVDGLNGARGITMNASGTYVYVASQVDDALAVFSRDTTYGDLTYVTSIKDSDPGIDGLNTANGIAISPLFNHIYVASYDDDAISVFNHYWGVYVPVLARD